MTVIFSDDFESGNLNAWTGTAGSPSVTTGAAHTGTYGMSCTGTSSVMARKTISPQTTLHVRFYVKWSALGTTSAGTRVLRLYSGAAVVGMIRVNSNKISFYNGVTVTYYDYAVTMQTNTWYCIEVKYVVSLTVGEMKLYLDNVNVISQININTGINAITDVYIGITQNGDQSTTANIDDVVFADTYIGPLQVPTPTLNPAGGTYNSTQSITISDAQGTASIYYTDDGSTPSAANTLYSSPISVALSKTLKAIGIETGYLDSGIASEVYVINLAGDSAAFYYDSDNKKKKLVNVELLVLLKRFLEQTQN